MVGIDFACCAPANEEKSEENPYNADVQVGRRLGLPGVPGTPSSAGPSGPCDARRFLSQIWAQLTYHESLLAWKLLEACSTFTSQDVEPGWNTSRADPLCQNKKKVMCKQIGWTRWSTTRTCWAAMQRCCRCWLPLPYFFSSFFASCDVFS